MSNSSYFQVTFLTRKGCPGSSAVYKGLLAGLASWGISEDPVIIDLDELSVDDYRTGYGTPTVLVGGEDLFGRSKPESAAPI